MLFFINLHPTSLENLIDVLCSRILIISLLLIHVHKFIGHSGNNIACLIWSRDIGEALSSEILIILSLCGERLGELIVLLLLELSSVCIGKIFHNILTVHFFIDIHTGNLHERAVPAILVVLRILFVIVDCKGTFQVYFLSILALVYKTFVRNSLAFLIYRESELRIAVQCLDITGECDRLLLLGKFADGKPVFLHVLL